MRAMVGFTVIILLTLADLGPSLGREAVLHWVQGEGAESCASEHTLAEAVQERLGVAPAGASSNPRLIIDGEVERVPQTVGWKATIRARAADGTELGHRELRETSEDCRGLDEKLT